VHDTLQYHIYVRRKFHSSVACYKFTTYCTQIHKHLYSEGARHGLSCCIYIRTKFALLSASLNDKLYSKHFPSCFFNSWVQGVQQVKTKRQREANGSSATKKSSSIFKNTNAHYHVCTILLSAPIPSQPASVYTLKNIPQAPTSMSSKNLYPNIPSCILQI
jgi:hypothetical protein